MSANVVLSLAEPKSRQQNLNKDKKGSIENALDFIFNSDDDMNKPVGKMPSKVA